MKIGIIGAMEVEVEALKNMIENLKIEKISGTHYYSGSLLGSDVVVAQCGIGKVNAAICTQTMILKFEPNIILNTGVAGGVGKQVKIADIVIATQVVQHDMDTSPLGDPVGYISGLDIVKIPCSKFIVEKLVDASKVLKDTNVFTGLIASGDQFIQSNIIKEKIVKEFDAIAVEMEGGSIGHVCYISGIDFCVIRAISDSADDSSHMDFPEFVKVAAKKSTELVLNFLKLINN